MTPATELFLEEDGAHLVARLIPGRSRSADERVGLFLLPVLVASVLVAIAYVLLYLGIAIAGSDPAIVLVPYRSWFTILAAVLWVVSTIWLFNRKPDAARSVELKVDADSVTLVGEGTVGFYSLLSDLRDVAELSEVIQLIQTDGTVLSVPMAGNSSEARALVAERLRGRVGAP